MAPTTDELYQNFMASTAANTAANERARRELRRLLSSSNKLPEQQSPLQLLPIGEMELRLQLIEQLEDYWHQNFTYLTRVPQNQYRALNDFEVSALLQMDLNSLRYRLEDRPEGLKTILGLLQSVPATLKIFATKKLSNNDTATAGAALGGDAVFEPEPVSESSASERTTERRKTKFEASGKARRNSFYTDKRQQLDQNRCVITGTRDPEVCHIIPFAANSTEKSRGLWENCVRRLTRLQLVETLAGQTSWDLEKRLHSLFSSEIGVSDRHWNTISLAPTLHDWWGKAYFGLKYLGTRDVDSGDPDQIRALRIQFHWMVWREREIGKKPATPLGRTIESIKAAFPEYMERPPYCGNPSSFDGQPIVAITRPATGFNVETGDVFEVLVPNRHMQKMVMAFNLQWALIKILAMAGGAEALDDTPDHPEFLDESWRFPGVTAYWMEITALNDGIRAAEERDHERAHTAASERSGMAELSEDGVEETDEREPDRQGTE
ncbi:hypothetical protein B0I37DRAFT_409188 [Chaetomium sp. MPI-CAGE-AT-0009]|nr:hypothetical protein B0I37DRAFT_409188 [Chaetomium sp. MPI-CAGE-AT-0009]